MKGRLLELSFPPPPPDAGMVPREEHVGDGQPPELPRPRVVGVVEEAVLEAVEPDAFRFSDDARDEPGDRFEQRQRRDLPAGQDEVAERHLSVEEATLAGSLVDALVAAADENEAGKRRELAGERRVEPAAAGRQVEHLSLIHISEPTRPY